jgi:hypothetical protein
MVFISFPLLFYPCATLRRCAAYRRRYKAIARALIEHVAAYMRESRMEGVEDRKPWADAGATWQAAFREMAVAAWQALEQ